MNKIQEDKCYPSQTGGESWFWRKLLDHKSFDNLINISKINVVRDIPKMSKPDQTICHPCQHGNQLEPT